MPRLVDCAGCGYPLRLARGKEWVCDCENWSYLDKQPDEEGEKSFMGSQRTDSADSESSVLLLDEHIPEHERGEDATKPEVPSLMDDPNSTHLGAPNRSFGDPDVLEGVDEHGED